MGGFEPASAAMFALDMINQQRQARARERGVQAQAGADITTLRHQQEIRARQRNEALKRAQATQRARFGAQGIGAGGSAQAVLDGLGAASARDAADETESLAARVADINANVRNLKRRNLLEGRNMVTDRIFGEIRKRLPVFSLLD